MVSWIHVRCESEGPQQFVFLHLKDFDQRTNALQLKPSTEKQIYLYNSTENPVAVGNLEPEVQVFSESSIRTSAPRSPSTQRSFAIHRGVCAAVLRPIDPVDALEYIDDPSHPSRPCGESMLRWTSGRYTYETADH